MGILRIKLNILFIKSPTIKLHSLIPQLSFKSNFSKVCIWPDQPVDKLLAQHPGQARQGGICLAGRCISVRMKTGAFWKSEFTIMIIVAPLPLNTNSPNVAFCEAVLPPFFFLNKMSVCTQWIISDIFRMQVLSNTLAPKLLTTTWIHFHPYF